MWQAATSSGESLHFPWLHIHIARINKVTLGTSECRHVIINRPQSTSPNSIPPKLVLEFIDEGQCAKFVKVLERSTVNVTIKFERKPVEWIESAAQRLFTEARKGPISEVNAEGSTSPQPPSAGRVTSISKQKSLPFKSLPDLGTRRSTRITTSAPSGSASQDPLSSQWSREHRGWEKSFDCSLVYPRTGRDRATVDPIDIPRLDEGEFLNDNLILCYLRYLQVRAEADNPDISNRVYFMNTYFFETLKQGKGSSINYDGVKKWTAKIDLFSYDYIVVPVNENAHWYLLIICNPSKLLPEDPSSKRQDSTPADADRTPERQAPAKEPVFALKEDDADARKDSPLRNEMNDQSKGRRKSQKGHGPPARKYELRDVRIISLDSLGVAHSPACRMIREYLLEEIKFRKNIDPPHPGPIGMTAKHLPQQTNFCDCGVFLLGYVQHFLADPDGFVSSLLQKDKPSWTVDPSSLRVQIRETIFDLHRQQKVEMELENEKKRQEKKKKKKTPSRTASASRDSNDNGPKASTPGENMQAVKTNSDPQLPGSDRPSRESSPPFSHTPSAPQFSPGHDIPHLALGKIQVDISDKNEKDPTPSASAVAALPEKEISQPQGIMPSVECDSSESPSISDDTDQGIGGAHLTQDDPTLVSPLTRSPLVTSTYERSLPEPSTAVQQSIEAADEVMDDEPMFISTIPSSPPSRGSEVRRSAGVSSPRKRKSRVIEIKGDDEPTSTESPSRKVTGTRSQYFASSDVDRYPVYVSRQTDNTPIRAVVEEDRSPRSRRKRVKTIDLTD
ncbi:hypothetical protein jhhlp_002441 [Lomentospora prolificans]|uniref:Ubiquitin-like protease family profile domain-containing protein n=1 Tax=Lomentospora prolificans TaxID=41688 RepID=A0A2N3NE17_9PEZI|nr:hypothetical protein jhhlp_002441 [Lomentospora prolificans]